MSDIYFVCFTPGTSGMFVGSLLKQMINEFQIVENNASTGTVFVNGLAPDIEYTTAPFPLTSQYFFNNYEILVPRMISVCSVPIYPNFEIIQEKWPNAKVLLITHTLDEISDISKRLFYDFYLDGFEITASVPYYKILETNANLFSDTRKHPSELTDHERQTFIKIIESHRLLDGFHKPLENTPNNVFVLPYNTLLTNMDQTFDLLTEMTGITPDKYTKQSYVKFIRDRRVSDIERGWVAYQVSTSTNSTEI